MIDEKIKNFAPVIECFTKFIRFAKDYYFDKLQDKNPIPPIVVTLKPQKASFGYCTVEPVFKNNGDEKPEYLEISYNEQQLDRPIAPIFVTLLHEMVHAFNGANGIQDVTPSSQYHNEYFKVMCDAIGLNVVKLPEKKQYGWLTTGEVTEGSIAQKIIEQFCKENEEDVSHIKEILSSPFVKDKDNNEKKKRNKNLHRYQCPEEDDEGNRCSCKCRAKKGARLMCAEHKALLEDLDDDGSTNDEKDED